MRLALLLAGLLAAGCGGGGGGGGGGTPAAPDIASFSAAKSPITRGTATTLTAAFSGGTGNVDHGVGAVTSGAPASTGALAADTTFRLTVTGDGGTATRDAAVAVVDAALQPVVTAPASATTGATGLAASVPVQAGVTFAWTISGGTFTGGGAVATGASVTFTAGAVGTLTLSCTATNAAGDASAPGTRSVEVVAAGSPVITSFTAARSVVTTGAATTLTAVFANGTGSVDHGVGAVASGAAVSTGSLTSATTFTLTVTGTGGTATRTATVDVAPAPAQPVITAEASATAGVAGLAASVPAQAGMTFTWTIAGGTFAGGGTTATGTSVTFTAGAAGTLTLTCTATNAAGDASAPGSRTVTVVPPPDSTISSPLPAPPYATVGQTYPGFSVPAQPGATYQWSILNGNPTGATFTSGTTGSSADVAVGQILGTLTLQARVTSSLGVVSTSSVVLTLVPRPNPLTFTVSPPVVASGASATLTATFDDAHGETAAIDPVSASYSSGAAVSTGPLSAPKGFTLSVQNRAGTVYTWQKTVSVTGLPGSVPIGSSLQPRYDFDLIPLANGKILLATGARDPRAELYDTATGTFSYTGAMAGCRLSASTSLLQNGKVLVAGGFCPDVNIHATAEIYDPATGLFTPTGSLHSGRSHAATAVLPSGKVLLAGGIGPNDMATAELYDPATGQFTTVGSMQVLSGTNLKAIVLGNGKVMMVGWGTSQVEFFDPATNSFGGVKTLLAPRAGGVLLADGRVLLPGGIDFGTLTLLDSAEVFDPVTGTSTMLAATLSQPRFTGGVLLSDGRVALMGGYLAWKSQLSPQYGTYVVDTAVDIFDPATGTITAGGGLQQGHGGSPALRLPGDRLLLFGGEFRSGDSDYDPEWWKMVSGFAEIYDPSGATVEAGGGGSAIEAQLQGTWASPCSDHGGGFSTRYTVVIGGLAFTDSNYSYANATCSGSGTRSDFPGTFNIGPSVVASLGGRSVTAHQVDVTGGGGAPPYGLFYVDTTVSPNRLYSGDTSGGYDGSTPGKRPVALDSGNHAVKQ